MEMSSNNIIGKKGYYQSNRTGFKLESNLYRKTIYTIRCYDTYKQIVAQVDGMSEQKIKELDVTNKVTAARYLAAIDRALEIYVAENYREAVFQHVVYRAGYEKLSEKYFLGIEAMKNWTKMFVYGVAKELGEPIGK